MADSITDIYVLLKRLELLKAVIALQDLDDIAMQAKKFAEVTEVLEDMELIMETAWVSDLLNKAAYGDAMQVIDKMIARLKEVCPASQPETEGLRTEIAVLTAQITGMETELAEIEQMMYRFEILQNREVGEIALKVLTFKRRKAASKAEQLTGDAQAQKEMEDAQREEETYRGAFEEKIAKLMQHLSEEEMKEQNAMFKKIAKLTHPDLVDKRYEMEAVALFRKAKEARDANDIATVREIYNYLTTGTPFIHEHKVVSEIEGLRIEVKYLRRLQDANAQKLYTIKHSNNYQSILKIDNWTTYFEAIKAKMIADLAQLEAA